MLASEVFGGVQGGVPIWTWTPCMHGVELWARAVDPD